MDSGIRVDGVPAECGREYDADADERVGMGRADRDERRMDHLRG